MHKSTIFFLLVYQNQSTEKWKCISTLTKKMMERFKKVLENLEVTFYVQ